MPDKEDDICVECGEPRSDHGLFTNHDFQDDVEEFEDDDDELIISIKLGETTDQGPKPMPPVNTVEQSPLYGQSSYDEGGPGSGPQPGGGSGLGSASQPTPEGQNLWNSMNDQQKQNLMATGLGMDPKYVDTTGFDYETLDDVSRALVNDMAREGDTTGFGGEQEGGPGSGRKPTGAHGVVPGQLPPAKTPKSKPSMPSGGISPVGKQKTSNASTRVNESHLVGEYQNDSISDGLDEAVAIGGGLSAVSIGGKKKLEECLPCQQFDAVHKALTKKACHVPS